MVSLNQISNLLNAPCIKLAVNRMSEIVNQQKRFYLDQAATSWPKSTATLNAVQEYLVQCGAAGGRGQYHSARIAQQWIDRARLAITQLIHADDASSIALLSSGTHALNEALYGCLKEGDHVITTASEHNSLLRPLSRLRAAGMIEFDIVGCDQTGWIDPDDIFRLWRNETRLVAVNHASNVTGAVQQIAEIGRQVHARDGLFLVDAAQTLGYLPIDVRSSHIDYLAAPGHKGLGAILGTGLLYASSRCRDVHRPMMAGGTGTASEILDPELLWPSKVEVGNLNLPGIVSIAVAAEQFRGIDWKERCHNIELQLNRYQTGLSQIERLKIVGPRGNRLPDGGLKQIGVISLIAEEIAPPELAAILDSHFGIEVRSGFHCAAAIHRYLGTEAEGTVRISFRPEPEIETEQFFLEAIRQILISF
ncbi:MAG: putative cysteine desulfurase [Planctomycetota bacterium]|jgi:selenocysteine lyase/cysteine desulfurase